MIFDELQKDTMEVKDETGKSAMNVALLTASSFSKDAVLTTDYENDYIVRGMAFEVQRRISLSSGQTLYLEFDITKAVGKMIFSLPFKAISNGGNVFIDTYEADSSTGGTVLMTPNNLNALSSNVALTTVKTGVTPTGTATGLREYSTGSKTTNQAAGGGSAGTGFAKILDNSKPLYFKFVNQETDTVTIDFGFVWYELELTA